MALTPLSIRLLCDLASPGNLNDLNRNSQPPAFFRGDDVEIGQGQATIFIEHARAPAHPVLAVDRDHGGQDAGHDGDAGAGEACVGVCVKF